MWIVFIGIKLVSRVIETEKKIVHPMLIWMSVNLFFSVWKKKFNSNRLVFQHLVFLYRQFWHKCEIKEHSYRSPHAHVNRSRESQPHIQFSLPIAYASCSPLNTPFSLRARARSLYALTIYIYIGTVPLISSVTIHRGAQTHRTTTHARAYIKRSIAHLHTQNNLLFSEHLSASNRFIIVQLVFKYGHSRLIGVENPAEKIEWNGKLQGKVNSCLRVRYLFASFNFLTRHGMVDRAVQTSMSITIHWRWACLDLFIVTLIWALSAALCMWSSRHPNMFCFFFYCTSENACASCNYECNNN